MTQDEILDRYDAWKAHRQELFDYEAEHGFFPESDAMFHSDDEAVELLDALVDAIRYGDEP